VERVFDARFWDSLEQRMPYGMARFVEALAVLSDPRSVRSFLAGGPPGEGIAQYRLRPLGGQPVSVRPRTADMWALTDIIPPYHLPPLQAVPENAREIWDLGTNIGLAMAQLALRYPQATVTGVEMDQGNLELCRRNIEPYGDRCRVLHAAVWSSDGEVSYAGGEDSLAYRVEAGGGGTTVRSLSLNTLLAERGVERVDYVKIDIEGAEREVLRENTEWAAAVRALKVEVHEPYTVEECLADLRALGFDAEPDRRYRGIVGKPPILAVRAGA
jgi:FkbM family methyltransferase